MSERQASSAPQTASFTPTPGAQEPSNRDLEKPQQLREIMAGSDPLPLKALALPGIPNCSFIAPNLEFASEFGHFGLITGLPWPSDFNFLPGFHLCRLTVGPTMPLPRNLSWIHHPGSQVRSLDSGLRSPCREWFHLLWLRARTLETDSANSGTATY